MKYGIFLFILCSATSVYIGIIQRKQTKTIYKTILGISIKMFF